MILGAVILVYRGTTHFNLGDVLIILATLFYQLSHLFSKSIIRKLSDLTIIPAVRLFIGGLILIFISAFIHPASFGALGSVKVWGSIIVTALVFRTLDLETWYTAMKYLPLSKLSALLPLSAAVSFLGAVVILKETPNAAHFIGFFLILIGLIWLSRSPSPPYRGGVSRGVAS